MIGKTATSAVIPRPGAKVNTLCKISQTADMLVKYR
jgi:hypothetical protein